KRIRGSIVQFLVDAFRPDVLRPGPFLRGYYFTGVRELEMAATPAATNPDDWQTIVPRGRFAAEATQMFKFDTIIPTIGKGRSRRGGRGGFFFSDLFHRVVLVAQPLHTATQVDARFELYRRRVVAGVLACCGVLSLAFFVSWLDNRTLLNDIENAR